MSTVSTSQNTAQPNQQDNSYDLSITPMKRKRGRPRKDGRPRMDKVAGSEPNKRNKQGTARQSPISDDGLVGREVSCSFTGVFDAGYLLTVQVGSSGPILTGLVFDPRLSVPVSAENDIAPHLPMLGRNGFSPPIEEGFISQRADSSQAGIGQKAGVTQHIQAKESPTTSSFTSHAQNMMEVTPGRSGDVSHTAIDIPKTSNVFVEGAATETPKYAGLSDISASMPSNGYNPSEVSKPSNLSDPSEDPEAATNASNEPLNIPKEAPTTTEASLDVSNEVLFDISNPSDVSKEEAFVVLKPLEASENAQQISLDVSKEVVYCDSVFDATQGLLEHQALKTGDIAVDKLSSEQSLQRAEAEEPKEDRRIDESLGDGDSPGRFAGPE